MILNLSDDILLTIFLNLKCDDLLRITKVCNRLKDAVLESSIHQYLWKCVYLQKINRSNLHPFNFSDNWYQKVKEICKFHSSRPFEIRRDDKAEFLMKRSGHSATIMNRDYLFLYGGATTNYRFLSSFELLRIDNGIQSIVDKGGFGADRWLHTACKLKDAENSDITILQGGNVYSGSTNEMHRVSIVNDRAAVRTISSRILPSLYGHTSVEWENKMVIFGGKRNTSTDNLENSVYVVSFDDTFLSIMYCDKAVCHGEPPTPRYCHSSVKVGQAMYSFGGWGQDDVFYNDLHVLDLPTLSWSTVLTSGIPPIPRCQSNLFYMNSMSNLSSGAPIALPQYLVVFGGAYQSSAVEVIYCLFIFISNASLKKSEYVCVLYISGKCSIWNQSHRHV